jgi:hypothetical protein
MEWTNPPSPYFLNAPKRKASAVYRMRSKPSVCPRTRGVIRTYMDESIAKVLSPNTVSIDGGPRLITCYSDHNPDWYHQKTKQEIDLSLLSATCMPHMSVTSWVLTVSKRASSSLRDVKGQGYLSLPLEKGSGCLTWAWLGWWFANATESKTYIKTRSFGNWTTQVVVHVHRTTRQTGFQTLTVRKSKKISKHEDKRSRDSSLVTLRPPDRPTSRTAWGLAILRFAEQHVTLCDCSWWYRLLTHQNRLWKACFCTENW